MATNKVQPLDIILGIKGAEKLAALKSSFRELTKTVKQTDVDIDAARKSVNEYAKSANQSEAVVKGQIKAFEGLREQARMGGKVYRELSNDIATLKSQLNGSTPAIDAQRKSILELASGAEATAEQLGLAVDKLFALRNETRLDSAAFNALGKDIDGLNKKIASLAEQTKQTAKENKQAAAAVNQTLAKYEASAKSQAAATARREAIVRDEVLALSEKKKVTDELIKKENQLTAAISRRRQLSVQEGAREARRRVRAGARVYTGAVELGPVDALDQRLGDLPNTTAAFSQRLSELQDRLVNTVRGGDQYIQVALRIAQVQREASAATQGLGAALVKDLTSGVAVKNQKNLREVIGQLQAEMSELNTETAEGSAKYAENARQVNNLQKELDNIANSYRTVTDMARQATGAQAEYANTRVASNYLRRDIVRAQQAATADLANAVVQAAAQTPLLLPAAGQTSAPGTGAFMSGGARPEISRASRLYSGTGERPDQPSRGFLGDVQAISSVQASATGGPSGQSYTYAAEARRRTAEAAEAAARAEANYRAEIDKASRANDGSINSSNRLRSALEQFRSTLPTTSREFDKLTDQINRLDRESEKVSRRMSRRRMSPMQITQAAGAAISGGIFGGPEGFLGGVGGGLVGGVGGAFAGAAIGAQVGSIRQTFGEYTEYAAQIARLEIALKGITEVQNDAIASQNNYAQALAAAADVTQSLNVPQEVAIQGITRLTAAVKGAGGGVAEAELAFKNINAAIIATGGGAEQVQGAVTALVQIFSKGKVSAEEINQIAERLPGTFNKIAAASGRTGPELTKALQKGQVGLNDLMKFLVALGDEYGDLSAEIAGSSENAGARLQVAFNQMRVEVGNALQPIGAEFQDAFTEFIKDITPVLVQVLPKIGEAFLAVAKNIDTVVVAMSAALGVFAVGKISAIVTSIGSLSAAILALKKNAIAGAKALTGLNTAALLNPYTALAAGVAVFSTQLFIAAKRQRELNNLIRQGSVAEVKAEISKLRSEQAQIEQRSIAPRSAAQRALDFVGRAATSTLFVDPRDKDRRRLSEIKGALPQLEERLRTAEYDAEQGADLDLGPNINVFPDVSGSGSGSGSGKAKKARLSRLESIANGAKLLSIEKKILDNAREITQAQANANFARVNQLNNQKISLEFSKKSAENEFEYRDAVAQAANDENRQAIEAEALLKKEIKDKLLLIQYESALADEAQRLAIATKERQKSLSDQIFGIQDQLGLVNNDQRISRFRAQAVEQYGADNPEVDKLVDLYRQTIDPTFAEGIQQNIRSLSKELGDLIDPINQVVGAANKIGEAFAQSFNDAVTGASTAQQALAGFFRNVGQYFLELAAKIITKMVTITALNSLAKILPTGPGVGSPNPTPGIGNLLGNFFSGQRFANGGRPPVGRASLVGERGPELFVPNTAGTIIPNNKLTSSSNMVTVNVDARGTDVSGDNDRSRQLGATISRAVQAEMVKQQRPGGLLYSSR